MTDERPLTSGLKQARFLAWLLVVFALIGIAALFVIVKTHPQAPAATGPVKTSFGGQFTLVGADGKTFSSRALAGKPYAIYFGFTRCGDVCPTTLARLTKLRRQAADDQALQIVFVTIDPTHDGPNEVGQYATLFNAPIIGLTGSAAQIDQVKKQYGIYAAPVPNAPTGKEMAHTATILLFDRGGQLAGTISSDDKDADAVAKIKALVA